MHLKRLLHTSLGQFFISILLGLGLATLFRKACNDKNCLTFNGPVISDVDGKIYKHGEKCFSYTSTATACDANKQIVDMSIPAAAESTAAAPALPSFFTGGTTTQ
jgi:hypothetical protein